jgi:excisionase family DNA binding protein
MSATTITIPSLAMSCADAAFELGVSTDHVRKLIATGQLPASKVGSRILIRRTDLETLLLRSRIA